MPVKFYSFGTDLGGAASGGGTVGEVEQFTGTLGAGVTTITFTRDVVYIDLRNTHDSASLEVSFDGGTNWILLISYAVLQEPTAVGSIQLREVVLASAPTYSILATLSPDV